MENRFKMALGKMVRERMEDEVTRLILDDERTLPLKLYLGKLELSAYNQYSLQAYPAERIIIRSDPPSTSTSHAHFTPSATIWIEASDQESEFRFE
jgi:hypothetical protein